MVQITSLPLISVRLLVVQLIMLLITYLCLYFPIRSQNAFGVLMSLSDSLFLMNKKSSETIRFSTPALQHQLNSAICDYVKRFGRVASAALRVTIGNRKPKKKSTKRED